MSASQEEIDVIIQASRRIFHLKINPKLKSLKKGFMICFLWSIFLDFMSGEGLRSKGLAFVILSPNMHPKWKDNT